MKIVHDRQKCHYRVVGGGVTGIIREKRTRNRFGVSTYNNMPFNANIKEVKVEIPVSLYLYIYKYYIPRVVLIPLISSFNM